MNEIRAVASGSSGVSACEIGNAARGGHYNPIYTIGAQLFMPHHLHLSVTVYRRAVMKANYGGSLARERIRRGTRHIIEGN